MGNQYLLDTHPNLVKEFHPTKNTISLEKLTYGSKVKVWWLGEACHHEWFMTTLARSSGQGCAVCSGKQVQSGVNDLKTLYPELVKFWHPTKNELATPNDETSVSKSSYWLLLCGHEKFVPASVFSEHPNCRVCSNQALLLGFNDLVTLEPEVSKFWHPTLNKETKPTDVLPSSKKKVWWLGECGHEWEASPKTILAAKIKCPYCGNRELLKGFNDLATVHPEILLYWHLTKNVITPNSALSGSHAKVWLQGECGHEWEKEIRRALPVQCPFCSHGGRLLVGFNDFGTLSPELANQWHPTKNIVTVKSIRNKSDYKGWWLGDCGHEWEAAVNDRQRGFGCPYCASQKVLAGFNDLLSKNPTLSEEWDFTKNVEITPSEITVSSRKKIWWLCKLGHSYSMSPAGRTRGRGCPECAATLYSSKPETELYEFVSETLGFAAKPNDRTVTKGELDIHIPSKNIAIEFNGLYWHNENAGRDKNYHYDKWKDCKEKGIQLIQIWEDEWNRNPEQVKNMLAHKLGVSTQHKIPGRKTEVIELTNEKSSAFLDINHIQGAVSGGVRLGLVEKGNPDTVLAVMVLKSESGSEGKILNLLRFATSVSVIGGFTKLLKYAERTFNPDSIITFSDNCVSDGGLYRDNGFTAVKELAPDYRYVVKGERVHKFLYRLKRFRDDPNLQYEEGLSERELALLNNLPRIWDAGKTKWEKSR